MVTEDLILQAVKIASFVGLKEAESILMQSGVSQEEAFLAIIAAQILLLDTIKVTR
jgi:hypothetical protein